MEPVALVTGAGRGIGAATARTLGRRGYRVVVNYRTDANAADTVVADIESAGGTALAVPADVCDPRQADSLMDTTFAQYGRLDALVCNANVPPPFAPLETMAWSDFRAKLDRELAAAFHVTQRAFTPMRRTGSGRIVYVSSLSAELTRPGAAAHAAAKSALEAYARHVAAEAGPYGIGVTVVAPGAVRTDATAHSITSQDAEHRAARSVLHRMLEPDDVAGVIAALLGTDWRAVTGTRIPVDAGFRVLTAP
ncbi:SDR family oxidoreductase [Actinocatenispora rupis]|uniref:Beta-ketoacyl-ACP reductase n=1 Tax=Actinocatenispora rupis TaxID=519421 RepID=A0A8J3J674_9ACTN|nr:SDR family oxidoreductase [Actinocatenispora rupis]GID10123.1 beta-ketoacyl-ACP reductase [Actinocatenispora rupis]